MQRWLCRDRGGLVGFRRGLVDRDAFGGLRASVVGQRWNERARATKNPSGAGKAQKLALQNPWGSAVLLPCGVRAGCGGHASLANVWAVGGACQPCGCCGRGRCASVSLYGFGAVRRCLRRFSRPPDLQRLPRCEQLRSSAAMGRPEITTKTFNVEPLGKHENA